MAVEKLIANLAGYEYWPHLWDCDGEDKPTSLAWNDGDDSYISSETAGANEGIGFFDTQFIGDEDTINKVTFVVVAKNAVPGQTALLRIKSHAFYTATANAQAVWGDLYNEYRFEFTERANGVPWTKSWVNSGWMWAELIAESEVAVRVTQVFAIVDYVPSVPTVTMEAGAKLSHKCLNISSGAKVRLPIECPLIGAGANRWEDEQGHGAGTYGVSAGANVATCPQVRRVLTGTITSWATTSSTVTLSATVDPTKSILFFGFREATLTTQRELQIGGTFVDPVNPTNQIVLHKNYTGSIDQLRWWVIEFGSGVSVQHLLMTTPGNSSPSMVTGSQNLSTPVPQGRSLCLLNNDPSTGSPTAWNADDFCKLFLAGAVSGNWTNVTWELGGTQTAEHHLHIQVVTFDEGCALVQYGEIAHSTGASVTATLASAVPLAKLLSFWTERQVGGAWTASTDTLHTCTPNADPATGLTFQSYGVAGSGTSIYWYAAKIHAATVQHYDVDFAKTGTVQTVTLTTPVDVNYAVPITYCSSHQYSNMRTTGTGTSTMNSMFATVEWGTVVANKASTIVITRAASGQTTRMHMQVVEFVPYTGTGKTVYAGANLQRTVPVTASVGLYWGPPAKAAGAAIQQTPTAKSAGAALQQTPTALTASVGLQHGPSALTAGVGTVFFKTVTAAASLAAVSTEVPVSAGAGLCHGPTAMAAGAALLMAVTAISAGAGIRHGPAATLAGSDLQKTNVLSDYTDTWSYYYCTSGTPTDYYAAAFYGASYDKSAWSTGPGIFAWPADGLTGLTATTVGTSGLHHATGTAPPIYIIRDIYIPDKAKLVSLEFKVIYDDGFVFWVNGTELTGSGMPTAGRPTTISGSGTTGFSTETISSTGEGDVHTYTLTGSMLDAFVTGTNRIAGICLDCNATSTDIGFGVKITATHLASWCHKDVSAGAHVATTVPVSAGAELSGVALLAGAGLVHGPTAMDAGAAIKQTPTAISAGVAAILSRTLDAGASLPGKEVTAGAALQIQKDALAGSALKQARTLDSGVSVKTVGSALSLLSDDFSSPAAPSDIDTNKWQEYVQATAGSAGYGHVDDSGTQRGRILGGTGSDQHWMLAKNWTEADYDATVRWKYNSTTSYYVALSVRVGKTGDSSISGVNNIYLQINPSSSSNNVILQRRYWTTSCQTVAVATGSLSVAANTEYRSRIRVSGSNIKAWVYNAAGTAVVTFDNSGAGYDISTTNPTGPPGFKFSHSSETSSDWFTFWDFQVTRISSTSQFELFAGATWSGTILQYAAGAGLLVPSIQRDVVAGAAINTLPAQYCPPMVFGSTESQVAVHVEYQAAADQYIEYGPSEAQIAKYTTATQTNATLFTQNIPNGEGDFTPGSHVWYRVRARNTGSGTYGVGFHHFTQLARSSSDSTPWTWVHVSDSRGETANTISPKFTDVIQKIFPGAGSDEFLLCTGDNYNPASDDASGITTSTRAWRSGTTGWGQYGEKGGNLQLKHTFGNHELDSTTAKADARKVRFLLGPCASLTGQQTDGVDSSWKERYYYFTWGGALFVVLDAYAYAPSAAINGYRMSPAQCSWLTAILEQFKEYRWKFLCLHKFVDQDDTHSDNITPLCGAAANQTFLFNLIKKYGVQVVWNGHYHGWGVRQRSSREWYVTTNFENSGGGAAANLNGDVNDKRYMRVRMGLGWNGSSYDVNSRKLTLEYTKIDGTITQRQVINTSDSPWTWGEKIVTCSVAVQSTRQVTAEANLIVPTVIGVSAGVGVVWARTPITAGVGLTLTKGVSAGAGVVLARDLIDAGAILQRTAPVSAGSGLVHGPTAKAAGAMLQQTPTALVASAGVTLYKLVDSGAIVTQPGEILVTASVGVRWTLTPAAGAGICKELVTAGMPWVEVGTNALPTQVYGHTTLSHLDKLWLIGGSDGTNYSRKVYWSSDFGATWTEAGTNAIPQGIYNHASVLHEGRMWILGGATSGGSSRKAYWSTDGATWTEAGNDQLPSTWTEGVALSYDGWIWLIGGYSLQRKQVWRSQDCLTWYQVGTDTLPFKIYRHAGCVHDGKMWIAGGYDTDAAIRLRKVFWSTDGATWTEAGNDALPTGIRQHRMVSTDGRLWIVGGNGTGAITLRTILSSSDGITWREIGVNGLPSGSYYNSLVVFRDRIICTGGYDSTAKRTVYSSPALSGLTAGAILQRSPAALTASVGLLHGPAALDASVGLTHGPAAKAAGAGVVHGPTAKAAGAALQQTPTALYAGATISVSTGVQVSAGAGLLHGPTAKAAGAALKQTPDVISAGAILSRSIPVEAGADLQAIWLLCGAALQQSPTALDAGAALAVSKGIEASAGAGLVHGPAAKAAGAALKQTPTALTASVGLQHGPTAFDAGALLQRTAPVSAGSGLRHGPAALSGGAGLYHGLTAKSAGAALKISRTPIDAGSHIVGSTSVSAGAGLVHGPAAKSAGAALQQTPAALDAGALPTLYRTLFAGAAISTTDATVKTWLFISRVVPTRRWNSRVAEREWDSRT